jgi:hypothetical protein
MSEAMVFQAVPNVKNITLLPAFRVGGSHAIVALVLKLAID